MVGPLILLDHPAKHQPEWCQVGGPFYNPQDLQAQAACGVGSGNAGSLLQPFFDVAVDWFKKTFFVGESDNLTRGSGVYPRDYFV